MELDSRTSAPGQPRLSPATVFLEAIARGCSPEVDSRAMRRSSSGIVARFVTADVIEEDGAGELAADLGDE